MTQNERITELQEQLKQLEEKRDGLKLVITRANAAIKTTAGQIKLISKELDGLVGSKIEETTKEGGND